MRSLPGLMLLAFAVGVVLLQRAPALPPVPVVGLVVAVAGLVAGMRLHGRARAGLVVGACLLLGFAYAAWRAEVRLADVLDPAWEGETLHLTGVIDDLPSPHARGTRFVFEVEAVEPARARVPARISLAWFTPLDRDDDDDASAVPDLRAGERWSLRVRLKRPHGNVNPGGFDLEAWLLQHGLRATGYVVRDAANARLDAFAGRPGDYVQRARERVRERIQAALGAAPYAGVIVALAIGDQRAVSDGKDQAISKPKRLDSSTRNALKIHA